MSGGNSKNGGYGSTSKTNIDSLPDQSSRRAAMIEGMHGGFINQIRQQSQNVNGGPIQANFQIPRSRRRPMVRTKSLSDFGPLADEDVEEMRQKLLKRYGTGKSTFPIKVSRLTRQQKVVLASICLVDFTSFAAMSILAPFYPSEASMKGVPTSISGFVFSVYALVVFLSSPLMGIVITHVGPKFMLIIGVILGGFCNILFGLLDRIDDMTIFITYCFLVRIFEALGASMIATSCYTFVAQIFPDNIGSILGTLEIFVGIGMSVGPAIGGLLYDWGGYGLPFYSLGVLMLLTIPINMFLLPSSEFDEESSRSTNRGGSLGGLLKLPPVVIVCLVVVVVANTWALLDPTLEPHLREFGLSAKQLGLFFLLSSLLYAVSSPIWGWLADKMTRTWIMMVIGLFFSGVGLLLIGPADFLGLENTIWLNIVALIILGVSVSMALLPTFEAILDFALENNFRDDLSTYGLIAGLWSSAYSAGEVIGPSLGGFLLEHYGFPTCATVMASFCFVMAVVVLVYFLAFHPDDSTEKYQDSREKGTETSDSGISETGHVSCSSSSSSLCGGTYAVPVNLVNENTPLLSRSWDESTTDNALLNRLMTESTTSMGKPSNANAVVVPVSNENRSSFDYSVSFPKVLKHVCMTEFGAVEV